MSPSLVDELTAAGTTMHRVYADPDSWIDRYGEDFLITSAETRNIERLKQDLLARSDALGLKISTIYGKLRQHNPKATDGARKIYSTSSHAQAMMATEHGISYRIDFSGYSCGFFLDQRHNRRYLSRLAPKRLLNTFAYTGSFSVVAAMRGAETWSIDLSKKALQWAKLNFVNNHIDPACHHFYADDVLKTLPRLRRRGLVFDAIILDPPTFSRGAKGKLLRAEETYPDLIRLVAPLLSPGGSLLLSSNATSITVDILKMWAGDVFSETVSFHEEPVPEDLRGGPHAASLWCIKKHA